MIKTKHCTSMSFCGSSSDFGEKEFDGTTVADVLQELQEYMELSKGHKLKDYAKVYINCDYLNEHPELENDNRKVGRLFYKWEDWEAPKFTLYTTDYCEHLGLSF